MDATTTNQHRKRPRAGLALAMALAASLLSTAVVVVGVGAPDGAGAGATSGPLPTVAELRAMAATSAVPATLTETRVGPPETVVDRLTKAEEEALAQHQQATAPAPATVSVEPAPPPDPEPVPVPEDAVHQAIAAWFGDAYSEAVAIANCESGLNPYAVSAGGGNHGLFQINVTHKDMVEGMGYSWDQIYDPWVNSEVAYTLYAGSGWGPWACKHVL